MLNGLNVYGTDETIEAGPMGLCEYESVKGTKLSESSKTSPYSDSLDGTSVCKTTVFLWFQSYESISTFPIDSLS